MQDFIFAKEYKRSCLEIKKYEDVHSIYLTIEQYLIDRFLSSIHVR